MLIGHLVVFASVCLWASNHVATRALNDALSLSALSFWRWAIALALMAPLAWPYLRRDAALLRAAWPRVAAAGANGMGLFAFAISAAPYHTAALNVGLIAATTTLWILLFNAVLRIERIAARQALGIVLAFAGAAHIVLAGRWEALAEAKLVWGDLYALAAAALWAAYALQLRRLPEGIHPLAFNLAGGACGLAVLALVYLAGIAAGDSWLLKPAGAADPARALGGMAYVAIGPTLLGNLLWIVGVQRIGAARAGALMYLMPVVSSALAVALLGETLAWFHAVGAAGIAAGLVLAVMAKR
ncbi:MAG: DMT family transporter [Alphaproteobacteria bacterium]|nr:DMT family transporter [Alphaproteobacteria bacterium]